MAKELEEGESCENSGGVAGGESRTRQFRGENVVEKKGNSQVVATSDVGDEGDDGSEGRERHGDGLVGRPDDEDLSNPDEFVSSDLVDS